MTTEMRPMSLGELLDRGFSLYRKHFLIFVGIVALPQLLVFALQIAQAATRSAGAIFTGAYFIWLLAILVVGLGSAAASQGATVISVSQLYLGRQASISSAFAGIKGRIFSLALIMIGVGIGIGIGFVLLIIPGIILGLMWSLAIPVAVLEDTGLSDSTSRSRALTKGSRGRIFLIYLLYLFLLYGIIFAFGIGIGVLSVSGHPVPPIWAAISIGCGTFIAQCLVQPLLTIMLSLVYYDQKVRKEAFDLQHMMALLDAAPGGAAVSATV